MFFFWSFVYLCLLHHNLFSFSCLMHVSLLFLVFLKSCLLLSPTTNVIPVSVFSLLYLKLHLKVKLQEFVPHTPNHSFIIKNPERQTCCALLFSLSWESCANSTLAFVHLPACFVLTDLHMCVTETTQSAQCQRVRVNACSWTLQGILCLQTAAKQEMPVRNWGQTPAGSPLQSAANNGATVAAMSFSKRAAWIE